MASIKVTNATLAYPMLGAGTKKKIESSALNGAGSILVDGASRGRSVVALRDINCQFSDGDKVGLIGRNGSGKSTMLRLLAGIYEPNHGTVDVNGDVASLLSVGLGMRPEATGIKNIEFATLLAGLHGEEKAEKIDEIAEFSELGQYLEMPIRTYSNGMAMRLKFACATAFSPQILLMDEWLGAGDPQFQKKANARLNQLVSDAGILVIASHNHKQILANCNIGIWLHEGGIEAYGPVDEVVYLHDLYFKAAA